MVEIGMAVGAYALHMAPGLEWRDCSLLDEVMKHQLPFGVHVISYSQSSKLLVAGERATFLARIR